MSARRTVALHQGEDHDRTRSARARPAEALPGASVGEPDERGIFEVELEAESRERALDRVRDVDDEAEHDEARGQGRGGRLEDEPDER